MLQKRYKIGISQPSLQDSGGFFLQLLKGPEIEAVSHHAKGNQQAGAAEENNGPQRSLGVGSSYTGDECLSECRHFYPPVSGLDARH